jgi:hypothetical protein
MLRALQQATESPCNTAEHAAPAESAQPAAHSTAHKPGELGVVPSAVAGLRGGSEGLAADVTLPTRSTEEEPAPAPGPPEERVKLCLVWGPGKAQRVSMRIPKDKPLGELMDKFRCAYTQRRCRCAALARAGLTRGLRTQPAHEGCVAPPPIPCAGCWLRSGNYVRTRQA